MLYVTRGNNDIAVVHFEKPCDACFEFDSIQEQDGIMKITEEGKLYWEKRSLLLKKKIEENNESSLISALLD